MAATPPEGPMREMIRQLGVDVLEFRYNKAGVTFAGARRTCEQCANIDACRAWLAFGEIAQAPEFCPNRSLFQRFMA
ncbi:MAG: DUF6455 family protein [Hyphomonadaceae bacterium]